MRKAAPTLALLLLLLSCGPSEPQKRELARLTVHSWTATLNKTADALQHGAVPPTYARQVVAAARDARADESAEPEWRTLPPGERAELDRAIDRLAAMVGQADDRASP